MLTGKRIEGTIGLDLMTGVKSFNMFHRTSRSRLRDKLIKKLPWGWVKESLERIKVYGSFPKDLGTARVMGLLEDHTRDAKNALIDREIIDFV
jgi:hypothetical protein